MIDIWHADTYSQFLDMRTKPAKDLLAAIPDSFIPQRVYDLGCGPGNSTILLKQRWSDAQVIGLDNSEDMLREAKTTYPALEFVADDLAIFHPNEQLDCIFANASLQWLDNHAMLIPRLLRFLKPGGFLAIQMPNNFHFPSHQVTIQLLENNPKWQYLLKVLRYGHLQAPFYHVADYYNIFTEAKVAELQLWETEYIQVMNNHQDIFNWVKGTGLRPILAKLEKTEQAEFEQAYVAAITQKYSLQQNGKVLLPFRRLFMVAKI